MWPKNTQVALETGRSTRVIPGSSVPYSRCLGARLHPLVMAEEMPVPIVVESDFNGPRSVIEEQPNTTLNGCDPN